MTTDISTDHPVSAIAKSSRLTNRLFRTLPALAFPDFRLLLGGTFFSMNGWSMQQVVLGWYVWQVTGSAFLLGLVTFFNIIPTLFVALPGGVLADRFDKRKLMLVTQALTFLVFLFLAAAIYGGYGQVWTIYTATFVAGLLLILQMPARQAIIVELVGRSALLNAIAITSGSFNLARMSGAAAAGLMLTWFGIAPSVLAIASTYLAVTIATWFLNYRGQVSPLVRHSFWHNLGEGLSYARGDTRVWPLLALVAVSALLAQPYMALLPAFATDVLGVGAEGLGLLIAATAVGALVSAAVIAVAGNRLRHRGMLLFGLGLLGSGAITAFGLSSQFPLSLLALAGFGLLSMGQMTLTNTMLQILAPDHLRGRLMSLFMLIWGLMPIGTIIISSAAETFGVQAAVAGAGALSLLLTLAIGLRVAPALRSVD